MRSSVVTKYTVINIIYALFLRLYASLWNEILGPDEQGRVSEFIGSILHEGGFQVGLTRPVGNAFA